MWFKFRHNLQKIFIAGLLTVLPLTITFWLLKVLFEGVDSIFRPWIIHALERLAFSGQDIIAYVPGLGIAVTVMLILLVGLLVTNIVGKKMVEVLDYILSRIPLVRTIYTASKQFLETISLANSGDEYNKVVLVEYPRRGLYSLGFVTCDSTGEPQYATKEDVVNVFVPTTPNPTSGMLIMIPRKDLINLSMSVEDGLKLVVSAGIVTPPFDVNNHTNPAPKPKKGWFK